MRRLLPALLLLCVSLPGQAPAAPADPNGIAISDAWSRAAMSGRTGVVYLTITDTGAPDRLTGANSPVATTASLHESFDDHGIMKMRPVPELPVQPGVSVTLAPGGYHIMLEGLKQALQPGQTFPVTLTFANAGPVTATATVQKAGTAGDHGSMDMQGGSHPTAMPSMSTGGAPQH